MTQMNSSSAATENGSGPVDVQRIDWLSYAWDVDVGESSTIASSDMEGSIPRSPEWYREEPFDPRTVAFWDDKGVAHYFMNSPLDEAYAAEPGDMYPPGSLPPEEREVRDTLMVSIVFRRRVSGFAFWWSQFFRPTQAYRASREWFNKLEALCTKSPEYRASLCRLANCESIPPELRMELKRIVDMRDKHAKR